MVGLAASAGNGSQGRDVENAAHMPTHAALTWRLCQCQHCMSVPTHPNFTPFPALQLLVKDLKTGVCPAHEVACLVVDECHRWGAANTSMRIMECVSA